jgi:predicted restriction endonuclease
MPISRAILDAEPLVKSRLDTTASIEAIEDKHVIARAWEKVKSVIAVRDKYRCRLCGKACRYGDPIETRADAHHIIFASAGGPDESWNLLHLCRGCHDLCHKVRRFWLSGNADDRDPAGKGCVKVERQVESGFEVVGFI